MKNQIITLSAIATILFSLNAFAFGKPQKESAPSPKVHQSAPFKKDASVEPVAASVKEVVREKPNPTSIPAAQPKKPTAKKTIITKRPDPQKVAAEPIKPVATPAPVMVTPEPAPVLAPAPKSEIERATDQASVLFGKLKQSLQNGAMERACDSAQRALNQC